MAVYFDHRIEGAPGGTYTLAQWHKIHTILAVGSFGDGVGGSVNLYANEGEHVADCKGLQRVSQPLVIQWHPTKKIVAVGWESGEVLIWNEHDHELYEVVHLHKADIKALRWTSNGTRLLTVDSGGLIAMWKTDSRGRPHQTVLCQHNLQDPVTDIVLRPPAVSEQQLDIASLARAAVSGDESALDMFNWKKGRSGLRISGAVLGPQEATCFFLGGKNGGVFYLNENLKVVQVFVADGPVRHLLYYDDKHILVTVTTNMMLSQHMISPEGDTREMLKVKLSGKSQNPCMVWAGKGVLATATGESIVRMWDLDKEENYVLNLDGQAGYDLNEFITCIAYCHNKGVLAGGTGAGHVAMWQFSPLVKAASHANRMEPEDRWKLQPPATIQGAISSLCWGSTKNLLAVNTVENVYILSEQVMSTSYRDQVAVVQTSPTQMSVDMFATSRHHDVKTDIQIKQSCNTKDAITVLDGKRAIVYEVVQDGAMVRVAGSFGTETPMVCLYEQNVYTLEPGKVQVRTFQGTVKQLINFSEAEGDPSFIDVCGHFLVISSSIGCIKIFDLVRREAKPHGSTKLLADVISDFGVLVSAKCNVAGSKVSVILAKTNGTPEPKLYIWDVELDTVQYFNLETGRGEQDDYVVQGSELENDASDLDKGKNQAAKDIAGRHPVSHQWDGKEQKLLVCEARILPIEQSKTSNNKHAATAKGAIEDQVEVMVVSLFVTPENGILIQDSFQMPQSHNRLIGLDVPYYYFMKKAEEAKDEAPKVPEEGGVVAPPTGFQKMVTRITMRDFVGLETADKNAIDAMMSFSYFLTIGNMDEAFKAIKLIKSESVWENMAKMCVKTRRLDVATVCLGNMGHARGAKAVREAMVHPELDARVACLAVHLGLQEDAERLLKNSKRWDLLNDYYQSSGQWGKAMETAEMFDRVHLRTTYYNYAKHLEGKGDVNGAIPNYEKSETYRFEVPRMLFDEPHALEAYITKKKDPMLLKWWAQYMESTGEMDTALLNYELSQDYLSLVRVYCYCGKMEKAAEICNETGDKAACYHLGRQYENNDMIREAIHFFTRAGAYGNAIRLCKEHGMEDQLMNLALLARPESMMNAARYYEFKPGCQDKAVMLYHKAGNFSKALDLAFKNKQFGALQMISEDLDENTDPELLQRCADFFTENSQFDRAVDLLGAAKKYWDALKLCMEQHVPMTEELVEKLTPPKEANENEAEERNKILEGIAEVCMQQRQYHLATKKYTQASNKVKAMKALLKSGDTEKIVFFAGVSRQKEIYVMAANYLQSLDWRKDPEIMKNIIRFYTKGRAQELLAGFYDACSQVEVDEYQNYDKAMGALNEAYKCMAKAKMKNQSLQEERLGQIKHKMMLIKKFIQARRTYEDTPDEGIKQCQVLLEEQNLELGVRMGDVYGFIIEHFAKREKWKAAYSCIEDMRSRLPKVNLAYYINMRTIESIHRALDLPLGDRSERQVNEVSVGGGEEEEGEEVEEDVIDDFPNEDSVC